jgi:hypothetical protein
VSIENWTFGLKSLSNSKATRILVSQLLTRQSWNNLNHCFFLKKKTFADPISSLGIGMSAPRPSGMKCGVDSDLVNYVKQM